MQAGVIEDIYLDSRAVQRRMCVRVITPPEYTVEPERVYPVLYFLHPWGLDPRYITAKLNIHHHLWNGIKHGHLPPMVVVLPAGDKSFYLNAADPPGHDWTAILRLDEEFFRDALQLYGRYGDYLLDEVIPHIERAYHVRCDRAGRAIGGISMGGTAAAVHAFTDPSRFSVVGIHSPALVTWSPEYIWPRWIFGVKRKSFAARNPADVARTLQPDQAPRVWLDCGAQDSMIDLTMHLHQTLDECGIKHHYSVIQGEHDKTYWEPRMPEYLAFYAQDWIEAR